MNYTLENGHLKQSDAGKPLVMAASLPKYAAVMSYEEREDGIYEVFAPVFPEEVARVEAQVSGLRQAYRDATRMFCQLAGRAVVDKLEDVDYAVCAAAAYSANPVAAGMCADTLLYCLTSLRVYDGVDAWDRI